MKKRLTQEQEFEIMKLVLDKFLWLGFVIMAFGLYKLSLGLDLMKSISVMVAGALVLVIFMLIVIREYEIRR